MTSVTKLIQFGFYLVLSFLLSNQITQAAEPYQLSGTLLENFAITGPNSYRVTPDGQRVVYLGLGASGQQTRLYSVSIEGGPAIEISDNIPFAVFDFDISPDSSTVVYRSQGMYAAPVMGGDITRLDTDEKLSDVTPFFINSKSDRVVYSNAVGEVYSAPIDGGDVVTLSDLGDQYLGVSQFFLSPDGDYVVMPVFNQDTFKDDLFSVPITGGDAINLTPDDIATFETVGGVRISSDSSTVVYKAFFFDAGQFTSHLFSASILGETITELDTPAIGAEGGVEAFIISGDNTDVIYSFTNSLSMPSVTDIYKVSISASSGNPIKLNNNVDGQPDVCGFNLTPDDDRVVYCASVLGGDDYFFYSVSTAGDDVVLLNPNTPIKSNYKIRISSNSLRVVVGEQDLFTDVRLFSFPISGGAFSQLSDYSADCFDDSFKLSANGQMIFYCGNSPDMLGLSIYGATILGASKTLLSEQPPLEYSTYNFDVSSDSEHVVYLARNPTLGSYELFAVDAILSEDTDQELCFPVIASNNKVAIVCL